MKYIKEYITFSYSDGSYKNAEYKWYVAIYRIDCSSEEDMIDKAKLIMKLLDNYPTTKGYMKIEYKLCYVDPFKFKDLGKDYPECIVFLLKEHIRDIDCTWPAEGSAYTKDYTFKLKVRETRNQKLINQASIPDNDLDLFFSAKKYNI
jgi:hypothetical protein